jgi:hypothetical protein
MIIKEYGLVNVEIDGNTGIYTHAQDIDPTLEEIAKRKLIQNDSGFSKDRTQRYIGTIPVIEFERHPMLKEAMQHGCLDKALTIYLQTEEGSRYVVNKLNTGRSGQVQIK